MYRMSVRFPELEGKHVVITGSSRGIGLGVAEAFAAQKCRLLLLADDRAVFDVAQRLGCDAQIADITDPGALNAALKPLPKIDVLINNAGLERLTPLAERTDDNLATFRRVLDVNVTGTFIATQSALPKMSSGARVIVTASTWSRAAEALFGAYVASKHALIGLIKTWTRELGPLGINVNGVAPGWVNTAGAMRSLATLSTRESRPESEILEGILSGQSLPGLMSPSDIVGPYLYLASDLARNVTGQTIGIDRGEVPW